MVELFGLLHEFVDTLVWPIVLILAVFAFRQQFAALFDRLSKFSAGGVSVELSQKVDSLQERAERFERERESDDDAIAMVDIQLSETLSPPFDESVLISTVKQASRSALESIYSRAKSVRHSAWESLQEKRRGNYRTEAERERAIQQSIVWMKRTIPIFRALTELEHRKRWHRYYAQLGYALKDTGDIREARTVLKTAIDEWAKQTGMPVSPHYRFNWVYCEVRIDNEDHSDGKPSLEKTQAEVKAALEEGSGFAPLREALKSDPEVQAWLDRNGHDWTWLNVGAPASDADGPAGRRGRQPRRHTASRAPRRESKAFRKR